MAAAASLPLQSSARMTAGAEQAPVPHQRRHLGLLGICLREPPGGAASVRPKVVAEHSAQRAAFGHRHTCEC